MIQDKHLYLNHFKVFQTFVEEMGIPAHKWNGFFQLVQKPENLPFLLPVLKQIKFNLPHIYPDDFQRSGPLMMLSYLNELQDDQLFFSLGLMSAAVYDKVEKEMVFSFQPEVSSSMDIQKIFEWMLNKDDSNSCVIPLKKEYLEYVQGVRQASELVSLFYLPTLASDSFHLGMDHPLPVWDKNPQRAEYQVLKTLLLIQNDLDARFLNRKYPHVFEYTPLLINEYFHRRLEVFQNMPDNKLDPLLTKRAHVLSSFFKLLLPPDMHLRERQKERYKLVIKEQLMEALRDNPDYFNAAQNTWNEMNAQWVQQVIPINRRLLRNRRNQERVVSNRKTPIWKFYKYLQKNEKQK